MPQQSRRGKPQGGRVVADSATRSEKVLQAAAELMRTGGVEAVSTRAVAAAAGVQPPVIYREFGGKDGLLDAITQFVLESYLSDKRRRLLRASGDPVRDLRQLWDAHVDFGLSHPHTYVLTFAQTRPGRLSAGAKETINLLEQLVARLGVEGRLRTSVERATYLVHAAGVGVVLTLISTQPEERDMQLSTLARDSVLSAITTDKKSTPGKAETLTTRAVALREAIRRADDSPLTPAERDLMLEWLARLGN
jgi:AcrR family transcriptional regulator